MNFDPQFKQRNLADQVADHIVVLIAKGDISPGQRLVEKELCASLGVSRIPLREALRILQAQGVVRTLPNRGSFVTELGSTETAEMLEVRLSVERTAFRRLLRRTEVDPSVVDELEECITALRRASRLNDQLTYCQADLAFHARAVDLCLSPLLKPIWNSLARGVLFFLMQERKQRFDYKESIREHELIVELLRQKKEAPLLAEIERHIMSNLKPQTQDVPHKTVISTRRAAPKPPSRRASSVR